MQHVPEITHIIDTGNFNKAHEALDKLLEMGPKNVEALKLKCLLLAHQGRFTEEARLWEKIIDIDPEDEEAITHFQRRYFDERESFYFTDLLADGGRRFVSHPRALITASFMGLFGCILFLILPSLVRSYNFLANPTISISCFAVLVAMPWLLIIYTYLTGLREIVLTSEGIALSTRLRSISMKWLEVEDLVLLHSTSDADLTLNLVFKPRSHNQKGLSIDLTLDTTAIRARNFFLSEISRYFRTPTYKNKLDYPFVDNALISF